MWKRFVGIMVRVFEIQRAISWMVTGGFTLDRLLYTVRLHQLGIPISVGQSSAWTFEVLACFLVSFANDRIVTLLADEWHRRNDVVAVEIER